jgi:hypothetical protein
MPPSKIFCSSVSSSGTVADEFELLDEGAEATGAEAVGAEATGAEAVGAEATGAEVADCEAIRGGDPAEEVTTGVT